MASIRKRNRSFELHYWYKDKNGERRRKTETFHAYGDAYKRKVEVENQMQQHKFVPNQEVTVAEFLAEFVDVYGLSKWSVSTYKSNTSIIRRYINPQFGSRKLQSITTLDIDKFYISLAQTVPTEYHGVKPTEPISSAMIEKVAHLLATAMKMACKWEFISKNPAIDANKPRAVYKEREIWSVKDMCKALEASDDPRLTIALHLAYGCSLRLGEALGLTWDCVHINDDEIQNDEAFIEVRKTLSRVDVIAIEKLGKKEIFKVFPTLKSNPKTCLVLKTPKSDAACRKIYLPRGVALVLREWKEKQGALRELLGSAYIDYNLVISNSDGKPTDLRIIENALCRLIKRTGLPTVVFHSIRHLSATVKMSLNHGNIADIQREFGHSQKSDTLLTTYTHSTEEARKQNAIEFNNRFYVKPELDTSIGSADDQDNARITALLKEIESNPELRNTLKKALE